MRWPDHSPEGDGWNRGNVIEWADLANVPVEEW
jgi:hypothetical protein